MEPTPFTLFPLKSKSRLEDVDGVVDQDGMLKNRAWAESRKCGSNSNLESRIEGQQVTQMDLLASLQTQIPNIISSVDLSLKVFSFFNNRPFTPTTIPPPSPNPNRNLNALKKHRRSASPERRGLLDSGGITEKAALRELGGEFGGDHALKAYMMRL